MVKNVIFDIGNVILYFNRDFLTSTYYHGSEYDYFKEKLFYNWEELDEDAISIQDYKKRVLNSLPERFHSVALCILDNWEYSMRYMDGIVDLIRELKQKGYGLYIISNMPWHFINRDYKFPILEEFDGILYSATEKCIKPDEKIFKRFFEKFNLNPEECVFTDDMKKNLATAARFGIKTYHYQNDTDKLREFILSL